MTVRRPVAPDAAGGLTQIASPDYIDPAILPAVSQYPEQSGDPATPSAGTLDFYAKTDHKMYTKDSTGTVTAVGSGSGSGGDTFAYFLS